MTSRLTVQLQFMFILSYDISLQMHQILFYHLHDNSVMLQSTSTIQSVLVGTEGEKVKVSIQVHLKIPIFH
jgi:hypothetical protein